MFSSKQKQLFATDVKKETSASTMSLPKNPFIRAGYKDSVTTSSGNGSVKLTTTGSAFVDDFGKLSNYKKPREFSEISSDMSIMWSQNPELTLKELFYVRMVTRTVQFPDGTKTEVTQRGQGLKHEGIFRMIWVAVNQPETFWKNISLFVAVGSWKDIITMLSYDLQYNGWNGKKLDWNKFGQLLLAGLENPNTSELIKKYLPQIKSSSQCKTLESQADNLIGKWICSLLFGNKGEDSGWTYKKYRKLKSSGTAHEWQQLISQKKMLQIDFNSIHGRALAQLVSGKFLKNQNLEESYQKWIESKPVAKYTGYVYELFAPLGTSNRPTSILPYQKSTIDKQFLQLVEVAKKGMTPGNGMMVVLDTSGSMTSLVPGTKVSAYSVGKSMALYFSYLLEEPFNKFFLEFSDSTIMREWQGATPVDQYVNANSSIIAGTNFLSVADHFGKILKQGVSEEYFPKAILAISDGEFNSSSSQKSTFRLFITRLEQYGFSKDFVKNFKVVLWDIPNGYYGSSINTKFEEFADCPNMIHMSGLDGAAVAFLTGVKGQDKIPTTSEELFLAAMNQEVLNLLEI